MSTATANPNFANTARTHEALPEHEITNYCDRCQTARAQVRVDLRTGGRLFFCGHHYNENSVDLILVTHVIYDEREWKPEEGAR